MLENYNTTPPASGVTEDTIQLSSAAPQFVDAYNFEPDNANNSAEELAKLRAELGQVTLSHGQTEEVRNLQIQIAYLEAEQKQASSSYDNTEQISPFREAAIQSSANGNGHRAVSQKVRKMMEQEQVDGSIYRENGKGAKKTQEITPFLEHRQPRTGAKRR